MPMEVTVDNGKIGIKVADGSFYPILDEGIAHKKRLVLTTVKDNQESVQIDLYKGRGEEMADAAYVGSLLIENISPDTQGNAEVELVVGVDEEGNLESIAEDKSSGARQSLSVGLKDLDESGLYEVPDFSFEEDTDIEDIFEDESEEDLSEELSEELSDELPDELPAESDFTEFNEPELEDFNLDDFSGQDIGEDLGEDLGEELSGQESELEEGEEMFPSEEQLGTEFGDELETDEFSEGVFPEEDHPEEELAEEPEREKEESGSKARPILVALLVILAIGLLGALLYLFVFMAADEEQTPPLQTQQEQTQEQAQEQSQEQPQDQPDQVVAEAAPEEEPQAEFQAEDSQAAESQPEAEAEDEVVVTPNRNEVEYTGGVWYKVRWGDTLWQISSSFYDNPRLYDKIAEENEIRNPDLIYAENSIFIPKTE